MTAGLVRLAFTVGPADAERADSALEAALGDRLLSIARIDVGKGNWAFEILFADPPDRQEIDDLLRVALGRAVAFDLAPLPDRDWIADSLRGLAPVPAGRFVVHGAHDRGSVPASAIGIEIEAGQAFGTGHHATTRGCLEALTQIAKAHRPRRALDIGTGTGVLAIATARLLHVPVVATDIDPVAVAVARGNVRLNRAGAFVRLNVASGVRLAEIAANAPYDLVLANILAGPLVDLATPVAAIVSRRSKVVLSGLLDSQAGMVLAAWRRQGFVLRRRLEIDGWMTLVVAQRRGTRRPRRSPVRW